MSARIQRRRFYRRLPYLLGVAGVAVLGLLWWLDPFGGSAPPPLETLPGPAASALAGTPVTSPDPGEPGAEVATTPAAPEPPPPVPEAVADRIEAAAATVRNEDLAAADRDSAALVLVDVVENEDWPAVEVALEILEACRLDADILKRIDASLARRSPDQQAHSHRFWRQRLMHLPSPSDRRRAMREVLSGIGEIPSQFHDAILSAVAGYNLIASVGDAVDLKAALGDGRLYVLRFQGLRARGHWSAVEKLLSVANPPLPQTDLVKLRAIAKREAGIGLSKEERLIQELKSTGTP